MLRPATLRQELTSAPAASWVVATGNTPPGPGPRRRGRAGCCHWQHSAGTWPRRRRRARESPLATLCHAIDLGAGGELSVAARNTQPGTDLGAAGELGVATGNTLPGSTSAPAVS
ncbi:hypothetical protein N5K55_21830 [Pseudomonas aeruginosa]|nr:hypothetical protein [Pseudomonas aeruginosa]